MSRRDCFILASRLAIPPAIICLQMAALAQAITPTPVPDANAKVAAIMNEILDRGEGFAEGRPDVKTHTWVSPSSEEVQHIREIGHDAIAPLAKALDPPYDRAFQRTLAVKLLGDIGGPDVVPPLKHALEADDPNSVRLAALAAMTSAPSDLAIPIIRSSAHDPDPVVAQRAKELLTDFYQLPVPQ